ncbi:MAG: sulfatase-like hydrolase/transferase [Pseudomonadota bacterium]
MKALSSVRTSTLALVIIAVTIGSFLAWRQLISPQGAGQQQASIPTIERSTRPIVLITIDTTRADRLEPYGSKDVKTPVMAELAQAGILFENARAVSPITLVSHASILSGRYPFEHGIRNNGIHYANDDLETLSEVLSAEGYHTAAFVSAAVLEARYGLDQGFDVYDDDLSNRRNTSPRMVADRPAEVTIDAAMEWLDRVPAQENYFLWVHLYDPHATYSPPPPYRDIYRDRLYDGEVAYMDTQIGRLLEHPRIAPGQRDEPVVALIADHGESLGEHGERTHAILAYDSTLHIPFIMRVPGGPEGLRIKQPVGQVDVKPTLMSLVGLEPQIEDGPLSPRDLSPLFEPGSASSEPKSYYSETFLPYYTYGWGKLRVLQRGRWKYISAPESELYDLARDPRELSNLKEKEPNLAHDLRRDLNEWVIAAEGDTEASLTLNSEEQSKLRSLGYLSIGSGQVQRDGPRPNPMTMIHDHVDMEHARALLGDRLYEQARAKLEGVIERDPGNLAALIEMVRALEGLGEIDRAINMADRALALDPKYVQTYLHMARLEAQRKELERALELLTIAEGLDPNHVTLGTTKVGYLRRLRRRQEANEALLQLFAKHPDEPQVLVLYAHTLEVPKGELVSAEKHLRQAYALNPYLEQAGLYLGLLLERTGRTPEAKDVYQASLQRNPDSHQLHGAMGQLLAREHDLSRAESHLRESLRLANNPRPEIYSSLGGVLAERGRFEDAIREYDRALQIQPGHAGTRNNAAIAYYRSGRPEEAHQLLTELVEDRPGHADAHNNLAVIAIDHQDWEAVVQHSKRAIDIAPGVVEAWNNLAVGEEELDNYAGAAKAYERALALAPDYWQARYNFGLLLLKTDDLQGAAAMFNEVLGRAPAHPGTHLALAELYAGPLEDPERAKIHWNAVLNHAPNHPRREEIIRKIGAR